ncbi:MAG: hypothetical protein ACE5I3_00960 [Phycisphaerae bacterium]
MRLRAPQAVVDARLAPTADATHGGEASAIPLSPPDALRAKILVPVFGGLV